MEMSAQSTKQMRAAVLPLAALSLAMALWACNDRSGAAVGLRTDTSTTTAIRPQVFDLRFKGVGVLSATGVIGTGELLAGTSGALVWSQFDSAAGTPVSLGSGLCGTTDCSWTLATFALPSNVARLATVYRVGVSADLSRYTSGPATDTVITSLDLEPAAGVFALSEFAMSGSGAYALGEQDVALDGLQAAASREGAAKRVITAVSLDAGQVRYLSYSWDRDSTAGYDAKVAQAALSTAADSARALAAEGYIITAFGGDPVDGFVLVGTRVHGDTAPRSLVLDDLVTTVLAGLPSGYAPVGYLTDGRGSGVWTLLLER